MAKLCLIIFSLLQGESPDCLISAIKHYMPSTALTWNSCQSITGTTFPLMAAENSTECIQMVWEFRAFFLIFLRAALYEGDVSFLPAFAAITFISSLVLVFSRMTESISPGQVPFLCVFFWGNNNLSLHISVVTTLNSTKIIVYGINEWGKMLRSIPDQSSSYQPRV